MKKTLLASSLTLALSTSSITLMANEFDADSMHDENNAEITTIKEGAAFGASTIIGGIVGGPIGAIAGAIGGTFLGKELSKADEYTAAVSQLKKKEQQISAVELEMLALKNQLANLQHEKHEIEGLVFNELELQLLFHTGNDTLDAATMQRLDKLAAFLKRNPELSIRLHGHADPRGTEGYNNVLAEHRALNVQNALTFYGVDAERVERYSYGANKSTAIKGDLDAYALERKVTIQIIPPAENDYATID